MTKRFYSVIGALLMALCIPMCLTAQSLDAVDMTVGEPPVSTAATLKLWRNGGMQPVSGSVELKADAAAKAPAATVARKAARKTISKVSDLKGTYVMTYKSLYKTKFLDGGNSATVEPVEGSDSILITNFYISGSKVKAHVDLQTMKLTIPNQVAGTFSSTGDFDVAFCQKNGTPDRTKQLEGTISADGTISISSWWGMYVASGVSKDAFYGLYYGTELEKCNATMGYKQYNQTTGGTTEGSFGVIVSQPETNVLKVKNFANFGQTVEIILNSDRSATIPRQVARTDVDNGSWYTKSVVWNSDYTNPASTTNVISCETATTARRISWGPWVVICDKYFYTPTTAGWIDTEFDIVYPDMKAVEFAGSGTEADPYQIKTLNDLVQLATNVNESTDLTYGASSKYAKVYKDKYFKLMNDIDMSSYRVSPIGQDWYHRFAGTFDGAGHTLKGLKVNTRGYGFAALFGFADTVSVIKNLYIENPTIETTYTYAAPVVAYTQGSVDNCHVTGGTVTNSYNAAGGVAGFAYNVTNSSAKDMTIYATGGYGGGIAGQICVSVANCSATNIKIYAGGLRDAYPSGGVVGSLYGGKAKNCHFSGTIDSRYYSNMVLGGIAGTCYDGSIEECFSTADIYGYDASSCVGGIVGSIRGQVVNCYSNGYVGCTGSPYVGGLAGYVRKWIDNTPATYQNAVKNSYSASRVWCETYLYDSKNDRREVIGSVESGAAPTLENLYFDNQIIDLTSEEYGVPSKQLTAAAGPKGFDASVWTFTEGYYPRLKAMADTEAAKFSASLPMMKDGDCLDRLVNNAALKLLGSTKAYYLVNGQKSQTGNYSSIVGDSIVLNGKFGTDTLYLASDGLGVRSYPMNIAPVAFEGDGTEANPYLIKTKADLITLSQITTKGGQLFPNTYFKITNDIDLEYDEQFLGICADDNDAYNEFAGNIDGGGHAIHKMRIANTVIWLTRPDEAANGVGVMKDSLDALHNTKGFIGRMSPQSTLKNLTIAADCDLKYMWASSAPLVAWNYGTVENCRNYADVILCSSAAGGIVSHNLYGGVIRNCYNAGLVVTGYQYAGGIAAYNRGLIENCENAGDVKYQYLSNFSEQTETRHYGVGGIAARTLSGRIENCVNSGTVSAESYAGGISAYLSESTGSTASPYINEMVNCVNYGQVFSTTDKINVGSLAGSNGTLGEVKNNYYDKQITVHRAAGNLNINGTSGITTDSLTSGKALSGFSTELWDFTQGEYPVLKQFADEPLAKTTRRIIFKPQANETVASLHSDAALGTNDGCTWALKVGKDFSIEGNTLKSPATVTTTLVDTLVATVGTVVKPIVIKSAPIVPLTGEGTAEKPYLITTADEWNAFANFIAASAYTFEGDYVALGADIDFTGKTIQPVSYDAVTVFNGDFDGRNHTVKGFSLTTTKTYQGGAFTSIGEKGSLHDATFEGEVTSTFMYAGGIVGTFYGKMNNVTNKVKVSSTKSYSGGVAAMVKSGARITNVFNEGEITSSGTYGAGLAAYSEQDVYYENCANKAAVTYSGTTANSYTGGLIAKCYNDTVIGCWNEGKVSASQDQKGGALAGLIAYADGKKDLSKYYIKNCYNAGEVIGKTNIAGLIHMLNASGYAAMEMDSCYNTGTVTSAVTAAASSTYGAVGLCSFYTKNSTYTNCWNSGKVSTVKNIYAAGLFGYNKAILTADQPALISKCYNTGEINSGGNLAAGIISNISKYTTIDSCWNSGSVTVASYGAGGIAAALSDATSTVKNCYNTGTISGGNRVGGIVGNIGVLYGLAVIENCFNTGDVSLNNLTDKTGGAGGISGYGGCHFKNVYSYGNISGHSKVGGLIGYTGRGSRDAATGEIKGTVIENAYFGGTITAPADTCGMILGNDLKNTTNWVDSLNYLKNVFYIDTCKVETQNAAGEAKTVADFVNYSFGEGWVNDEPYCMPTLATLSDNDYARIYSLALVTDAKDTYPTVTTDFFVGAPEGVEWSSSVSAVTVSGNDVHFAEPYTGELILTAKSGELTRTFVINCKVTATGIDNAQSDRTVVSERYFTTGGVEISKPQTAAGKQIYIVVRQYSDNTREAVREVR